MNYKILQSNNADSRTATSDRKEDLLIDTMKHIKDVQSVMNILSIKMIENSIKHDYTKIKYFEQFYQDWKGDPKDFTEKEWYKLHITKERHHSNKHMQEDFNLLDLIEEVVDKVCAGKSRSGKINMEYFQYDNEILQKALENTIQIVDQITK